MREDTWKQFFSFTQTSEQPWIAELCLTIRDKAVLQSPDGMLSDKHMDAANELLANQFPHLQGLQYPLKYKAASGLIPVHFSTGPTPEGLS